MQTKEVKATSILKIKSNSKRYDITVEGNHNFFGNNILIHNCESSEGRKLYNELLGKPYYITVKLDGTSGTYFIRGCGTGYEFGVCSRNNEYRYDSTKPNFYWYACKKQEIEEWLAVVHAATGHDWCIQGEIVGPKIQENKLAMLEPTLFYLQYDQFD